MELKDEPRRLSRVMRLDRRLRLLHPDLSWARVRRAIDSGQVELDGQVVRDPGQATADDAAIVFEPDRPRLPHARLDLPRLHEDADVLVIDKPAGLLTIPPDSASKDEDTVLGRVREYATRLHGRRAYAGVLHRLDRDTSGALALALSREAHAAGRALFAAHRFERRYLAIVRGVPSPLEGLVDRAVSRAYADGRRRLVRNTTDGREAVTRYRVLEAFRGAALVELELETGRQHQIRLHMQHLGHPLIGERVYVDAAAPGRGPVRASRQMLHAWQLAFPHPLQGHRIAVEAALPEDFEQALDRLRRPAASGGPDRRRRPRTW